MHRQQLPLVALGTALVVALLWALAFPGVLGLRDMVVLDHPSLSTSAFGFGATPARNAPQDGVLALVGLVLPASWVVRVALVGVAAACAVFSARFGATTWQKAAAMTIGVCNPFVIERLLQGQWSLAMAAWMLPVIAALGSRWRGQALALWVASITPSGLILGLAVALWTSGRRWATLLVGFVFSLPWLVPSLVAPPQAVGTSAFIARAEAGVGTLGSLLGLGGMWNAEAVPASRESGFAWLGVILFALLFAYAPRRLQVLAMLGLGLTLLLTFGPTDAIVAHVPGAALFRDSHKVVALMIPALVAGAGRVGGVTSYARPLAALAIVLSLGQIPDAPAALAALKPVSAGPWRELPGRTLIADGQSIVRYEGKVMVNPWLKATDTIDSGVLVVDGGATETPNPEYLEAMAAWRSGDKESLQRLGIGTVIENGKETTIDVTAATVRGSAWWAGLALSSLWLLSGVALLVAVATRRR